MTETQITAAALRWFTARQRRLAIGAEQRRFRKEFKTLTGFGGADFDISHHQQAKRQELKGTCQGLRAAPGPPEPR